MPNDLTSAEITFNFLTPIRLLHRSKIRRLLTVMSRKEKRTFISLTYVFCSDDYLLDINRRFLGHDFYTDIITFDLTETDSPGITGEIYISVDRVRENAKTHRVPLGEELNRVIFHGALHLCGFKDKSPRQAKEMRAAEDNYLKLFAKMFHVKQ